MSTRVAGFVLMLGNLVVGLAVLAPAGMLNDLSTGLGVSTQQAGWLVTFGAVVLCVGSPVVAWVTSSIDRRLLLAATLALLAAGHAASAFAPNYATLLVLRLVMLAVAAVFTPQAASTIALIVPEKERASAISFVFLGWSLAVAIGLPIVALLADQFGWRATYGALAGAAMLVCVLASVALPAGLHSKALSLQSWTAIAQSRPIVLLLAITAIWVSGQFMIFPYFAPLLSKLAGATSQTIATFFALFGIMGFVGNVIATRVVRRISAFSTSLICSLTVLAGAVIWSFGAGELIAMGVGAALFGLGSLAFNSMQQARLAAAAPALASGTIALNTSSLYVGQAIGSWLGGALIARELPLAVGYTAAAFLLIGLAVLWATRERNVA